MSSCVLLPQPGKRTHSTGSAAPFGRTAGTGKRKPPRWEARERQGILHPRANRLPGEEAAGRFPPPPASMEPPPSASPGETVGRLARGLLDLLYPPVCLTCGALAEPLCAACRQTLRPIGPGLAPPTGILAARSVGFHEEALRRAVLRLKFEGKTALAAPLGELLAEALEDARPLWRPDLLVPVPVHWTRALQRGFNQSELLAGRVSRETGIPWSPALRRTRRTPPQVGLPVAARAVNLRGAFAADGRRPVAGRRVVLVDDVRTTGATLSECAECLRTAGAVAVYALTVTYDR